MAQLVLRPSTLLLALAAASGAAATGNAPEPSTATTTTSTRPLCQGDRYSWTAGYGDCSNYEHGYGPNHDYCDEDSNGTFVAQQVCHECGLCDMEEVQMEECSGDRSAFDAGYGGCDQYAREHNHNWAFCNIDADNATGLLARQVCSECQLCHTTPASPDVPPSSGLDPGTAAVGGALLLLLLLVLGASGGALTLRSRRRRHSSDTNNDSNAVITAHNSGPPPAVDALAGERRMEWNVDQGLRGSAAWSVEQGIVGPEQGRGAEEVNEIGQSNSFSGMASNPSFA